MSNVYAMWKIKIELDKEPSQGKSMLIGANPGRPLRPIMLEGIYMFMGRLVDSTALILEKEEFKTFNFYQGYLCSDTIAMKICHDNFYFQWDDYKILEETYLNEEVFEDLIGCLKKGFEKIKRISS